MARCEFVTGQHGLEEQQWHSDESVVLSKVAGMCDYYCGVESHIRSEQSGGTATTAKPCIEFYSRAQSYCAFRRDDFCGSTAKSQLTLIPTRVYSSCV